MFPRHLSITAALVLGLACVSIHAQEEEAAAPPTKPCTADEYAHFDFWLGEWEVRDPQGNVVGHNTIKKILDGCAIKESWRGARGSIGYSFNAYNKTKKGWHQTWVDAQGQLLLLDGGLEDGRMVLTGQVRGRSGDLVDNRITWTPNDDGTVRQHWEISRDDGESWQSYFDGLYVPEGKGDAG